MKLKMLTIAQYGLIILFSAAIGGLVVGAVVYEREHKVETQQLKENKGPVLIPNAKAKEGFTVQET